MLSEATPETRATVPPGIATPPSLNSTLPVGVVKVEVTVDVKVTDEPNCVGVPEVRGVEVVVEAAFTVRGTVLVPLRASKFMSPS